MLEEDIGAVMGALDAYRQSELLRDILCICHTLYMSEEAYLSLYRHNTRDGVLQQPAELISVDAVISARDRC